MVSALEVNSSNLQKFIRYMHTPQQGPEISVKNTNILVPLVWIGPEVPSETYDLPKISWTTVSTDSHSTFVITSNIECIIPRSRCLKWKMYEYML